MFNRNDPAERERVEKVVYDMVDRGLEMEGSCTVSLTKNLDTIRYLTLLKQGEHGIGLGKKISLKKEVGPETIDVMRSIKLSLDPNWLMNPGKIFDYERDA